MLNLSIPIPNVPGRQDLEIEMSMKGFRKKIKLHYRVEVFKWSDCPINKEDRIDCIRDLVDQYSEDWVIYNIGMPTEEYVPLTFIRREDWALQQNWHMS